MTGGRPDFIIIGAPKCGTTSLARWLGDHPQVHVPNAKELRFLDRQWDRGLDWYRGRFTPGAGERFVGESTPEYLAHPQAPTRAAEVLPDTRYIVIVRDPVERFWSHVWFTRRGRADDRAPDPDAIIRAEEEAGIPWKGALTHGLYAEHLGRWAAAVGRESLLVLTFDDLRGRPVDTFTAACRFIGLDSHGVPDSVGRAHNTAHTLRSRRLRMWMMRHRVWARAPRLGRRLDRWNEKPLAKHPIDPQLQRRLSQWYADDTAQLAEWITVPETWASAEGD